METDDKMEKKGWKLWKAIENSEKRESGRGGGSSQKNLPMEEDLQEKIACYGSTNNNTQQQMDIATWRLNQPSGPIQWLLPAKIWQSIETNSTCEISKDI